MGIINQGILGGLRKKVGSVVGAAWKGIPVLRIYQPVVANPKTAAQVTVRTGFKGLVQFASVILAGYIKPLWDRGAVRMSGYNAFLRANKETIADGESPFNVDLVATKGKMDATAVATAALDGSGMTVTWDSSASGRYALATDIPFILALDLTNEAILFAGQAGTTAKRSDGSVAIAASDLQNIPSGSASMKVYLSFLRQDGTIVSDSASKEFSYTA